jgi:hypothetical protein
VTSGALGFRVKDERDEMRFDYDTYVVLDIPPPIAEQVAAIRNRCHDWFVHSLPIEITVAGSSGIGVFDPERAQAEAFAVLSAISAEAPPIEASLGEISRFPNSGGCQ